MQPGILGSSRRALSLEEWAALPEETRGELVDGLLQEEELPDVEHEVIVAWVMALLRGWLAGQGGLVLGSGAKMRVGAARGRMPDASAYLPGSPRPSLHGAVTVPPGIAVEVTSQNPSDVRRDRIEKMAEYAAFGIRLYWLLDPSPRTLEVYELDGSGLYRRVAGASTGRLESIPGCPGLVVDLDALWAEVDAVEGET